MNARIVEPALLAMLLLFVMANAFQLVLGQAPKAPYPTMAPLELYLIADRDAEIALARSAAPAALSRDAEVLVLGKDGYHTAVEGKNGFTCVVDRGWLSPLESPDFWNPKLRGPVCYNAAAVRSILPYTIERTKLILAGQSKEQMAEKIQAAAASGQLPQPEPGAMSYMLSKDQYLGDSGGHWHPHLMFHVARTEAASWGANLPDSPVVFNDAFAQGPEPETIFMVPVDHWSDGTPFTAHQH
jgi:hypothetical protein